MRIESGPASAAFPGHPEAEHGRELPIVKTLGVGPAMAARVVGNWLYVIGRGKLHVADISDPGDPKVVGSLTGLGNTRQIAVREGIAYVTARENGVFLVDVRDPAQPKLISHYDSIEVATGIDVSGDVMFVACRLHGLELVDVSNPQKPLHLSTVRTGEAQSVAVRNGYAYTGVWHSSELVVVDVRNPREPKVTAKCPLGGYGDGVAVRDDHVYVATGHHSRTRPRDKEGDPGFGRGHGLELFEISDPAKPVFVSRIKGPPFYRIGNDMWSVKVAGDCAFVADTHNGIFVVDISDPEQPSFVGHRQLPYVARYGLPDYVGGLALAKDHVYVAGGATDLHIVAAPGLAQPVEPEPDTAPVILPFKPTSHPRFRIYRPDGQVRAVDFMGDLAVVAAGSDGVHVVQLWPEIRRLQRYETQGFAMDVRACGNLVFVAEDKGGLSIWRTSGEAELELQGRYRPEGAIVREVVVPPPGRYALLQVNLSTLDIVDVIDPENPRRVLRDAGHGFLYQIAEDLIDDRCACVLWQLGGVYWYDLYGGPEPVFTGDKYAYRLRQGAAVRWDKVLAIYDGGYIALDRNEQRLPTELELHRVGKHPLRGRLWRRGEALYAADRATGEVSVLNVSDIESPQLLEHYTIPGNPGRIAVRNGIAVIPNGYEGLWVDDKRSLGSTLRK